MLRKVLQYCRREKLIENGDFVLAGVSGGADSVCMLKLLAGLQKEIGFFLEVVHVEHGIRGIESENDAAFVVRLCEEMDIPLQLFFVDAVAYAKEQRLGLEEAARILRYDCYAQAAEKSLSSRVKVALAHHADDNAETVLFQMVRGSGIDGMSGMRPKRELMPGVEVVRPMLAVTRTEIEAFLEKEGQAYCVDSTNADTSYSRNKIRCHILPMLEEVNAKAVAHMNQSAMLLRELGDYLRSHVDLLAERALVEQETGLLIRGDEVARLPEILKKELLHLAIGKAAGSGKDICLDHVESLAELFRLQVGRCISLPYHLRGRRVYDGILLEKIEETEDGAGEQAFWLELKELEVDEQLQKGTVCVEVPEGMMNFSLVECAGKNVEISKNTYTKCFDYDKIKGSFQIRTRQPGDYLIVDNDGHKKRLKEYFINEKIPSDKRDEMLLLAQDDKVLWVIGGRISADTKVDENTKRILKVQISGGNYHEG